MNILDLYNIDLKYIRDLSNADENVVSVSPQTNKENRPFVGLIIIMNNQNYCIPLSSPKEKHKNMKSQIDIIKIFDDKQKDNNGAPKLIGVLNLNNMIPVDKSVIHKIDLRSNSKDNSHTKKYKELMQNQLK